MTSGERISQLHDVARPGELRKGLRLVDDLQTDPPIFTGRTSSNTPSANDGRSSSHSRTTARGPRNSDGNPDSPQVVVFLATIVDVTVGS